jgi:ubiquinone/menaquinone biosynthesis C-methylase UbiE
VPSLALHELRTRLDRTGYRLQQGSLAASLGLLMRAFHFALQPGVRGPTKGEFEALNRRLFDLFEEDLTNVERGIYPRQLLFQLPVRSYLRLMPEALLDAPRIIKRRRRGDFDDLPRDIDLDRYPRYYRRNFHWQTDGWFSERSARLYDVSVEILFGGTADVMRRMALPPILEVARDKPDLRVLDIACGTGRFLLQLHKAAPRARLYGADLSPHYVQKARELLSFVPDVSFLVENVEALPLRDETFDVVSSIFLFHELPADARRNVAREAFRLLRSGGRFVICDSAQLSDSPDIAYFLDVFQHRYHEPYYKGYLRDDLTRLLSEAGFAKVASSPRFVSKIAVGEKTARV